MGKDIKVKLGDFGLSRTIDDEFAKTYVGTPYYMSPELADDSCYNLKSDIWALGCLIYELCCLEPPFQAKSHTGLVAKIKEGRIRPLPSQVQLLPDLVFCRTGRCYFFNVYLERR